MMFTLIMLLCCCISCYSAMWLLNNRLKRDRIINEIATSVEQLEKQIDFAIDPIGGNVPPKPKRKKKARVNPSPQFRKITIHA